MLKIFAKLIVLPVMVILIALSFAVSILSKIHYLAAVLVNAIFIMCAVIALSLQQWQNFGISSSSVPSMGARFINLAVSDFIKGI